MTQKEKGIEPWVFWMTIILILIALSFALSSCSAGRKQHYFEQHPEWSDETVKDINNNVVKIGMTKDMVRASYGLPTSINRSTYQSEILEQWVYDVCDVCETDYFYFENGKLIGMQSFR